MIPRIKSGQLCTVSPESPENIQVNDIVLCKVNGCEYLHLVKAIRDGQFQIGNNKGHTNGWVSSNAIFGKLIQVE